jgi:dTDP-4-amino-4,6-dideoxygalactose transaminase
VRRAKATAAISSVWAQPPRTEAAERLLTLPLYGAMSHADVDHVVEGLVELQS